MSLSAKTLFHFTSYESLKGILQNGFYPSCCPEQQMWGKNIAAVAIPMISFCDIRLTQVKDHVSYYGKFGIGLTKDWGILNGMNPVLYLLNNSYPIEAARNILEEPARLKVRKGNYKFEPIELLQTYRILQLYSFFKHNNTQRWNKHLLNFDGKKMDFYNEREWRYSIEIETKDELKNAIRKGYVPTPYIPNLTQGITDLSKFINEVYEKNKVLRKNPLTFKPSDIKYLIVEKDKDVKYLVQWIATLSKYKKHKDKELLYSKITSIESLEADH